jgi:hypothetical protein
MPKKTDFFSLRQALRLPQTSTNYLLPLVCYINPQFAKATNSRCLTTFVFLSSAKKLPKSTATGGGQPKVTKLEQNNSGKKEEGGCCG